MVSRISRGSTAFTALQARGLAIAADLDRLSETLNLQPAAARTSWLDSQWSCLNSAAPQIDLPYRHPRPRTSAREVVDPRRIVDVTGADGQWGRLNNRPDAFTRILEGLHDAVAVDRWEEWLDRMAPDRDLVELIETCGPHGPVYAIGNRGRHRAMFARAAALPALDAWVTSSPLPRAGQPIYWPAGGIPADRATRRHYRYLQRAGFATLERLDTPDGPTLAVRPAVDSDTAWAFDPPRHVAAVSAAYRTVYPTFGTTAAQAAMLQQPHQPAGWLSF